MFKEISAVLYLSALQPLLYVLWNKKIHLLGGFL